MNSGTMVGKGNFNDVSGGVTVAATGKGGLIQPQSCFQVMANCPAFKALATCAKGNDTSAWASLNRISSSRTDCGHPPLSDAMLTTKQFSAGADSAVDVNGAIGVCN